MCHRRLPNPLGLDKLQAWLPVVIEFVGMGHRVQAGEAMTREDYRSAEHKLWIRRQLDQLPHEETFEEQFEEQQDGPPRCISCGCAGNCECGHQPLDSVNGCTLLGTICPCCNMESQQATDAEVDAKVGQRSLFGDSTASGDEQI